MTKAVGVGHTSGATFLASQRNGTVRQEPTDLSDLLLDLKSWTADHACLRMHKDHARCTIPGTSTERLSGYAFESIKHQAGCLEKIDTLDNRCS